MRKSTGLITEHWGEEKNLWKLLFFNTFTISKKESNETNTLSVHPKRTYWSEKNKQINKKKKLFSQSATQ